MIKDIMEEYDDSYETKFAEKTENQKIDAAIELGYWAIRIAEVWEVLQIKNIIQNIRSFISVR